MTKIKITYEIDDGYAGGRAPQSFYVESYDLEEDMTEEEIKDLVYQMIADDMIEKVHPVWDEEQMPQLIKLVKTLAGRT